ncbi:c-type cytochrome [Aureibacter tunicatorum]|uniref:Cytochrome c domain-containing protein n=1 Tax=Aureibacter tunicatorum TaxID=866807 RepID=A0AAE3XRS7_9BACT|nr:cytochrome c [Aureibacter tunicatorum]MDR6240839.1 hypothetical protein [Aureibacter tunicatorum]BDD06828.1 hypothetical protein AUTU_43110 [Aureibacter tunicatorum]
MNEISKITILLAIIIIALVGVSYSSLSLIIPSQENRFYCGVTSDDYPSGLENNYKIKEGAILNNTGKLLFENNCTVCHSIHEQVVGPLLLNVTKRREKKWLYHMITNSQKLIQSGDTSAVKLYERFGKTEMPSFDFNTAELDSLIEYLDYYE